MFIFPPDKSLQAGGIGGSSSPAGAGRFTLVGPAYLSSGRQAAACAHI
jgi:hypothetical protein